MDWTAEDWERWARDQEFEINQDEWETTSQIDEDDWTNMEMSEEEWTEWDNMMMEDHEDWGHHDDDMWTEEEWANWARDQYDGEHDDESWTQEEWANWGREMYYEDMMHHDEEHWLCQEWDVDCQEEEMWEDCGDMEYWCLWEQSDEFYDCYDTWDEEETHQCWEDMAYETGCDAELVCDFYECMEHEVYEGQSDCWREDCHSECGEYQCALWHYDYENEDWMVDPCESEEDEWARLEKAGRLVEAFEGTFATAFNEWCEEGHCIEPLEHEITDELGMYEMDFAQSQRAARFFQDESVKAVANAAIEDMASLFMADDDEVGKL